MSTLELGFYGVIGLLSFIGLMNGFLKEIVGILALGAALVGSYFLQSYVETYAVTAGVDVMISGFLEANLFAPGGALDLTQIFQAVFGVLAQAIAGLNLPADTVQEINDIVNGQLASVGPLISNYLARLILTGTIYFILFLVILLIANLFLGALVKAVKKVKILGLLDRILGMALGAVKGLLVIEVAIVVMIALGTILNIAPVQSYLDSELALTQGSFSLLETLYMFTREQFQNLGLISPP